MRAIFFMGTFFDTGHALLLHNQVIPVHKNYSVMVDGSALDALIFCVYFSFVDFLKTSPKAYFITLLIQSIAVRWDYFVWHSL